MDNLEWVEQRGFSKDGLTPDQRAALVNQARERLTRWPKLLPQDARRVSSGRAPQKFCPAEGDQIASTVGDPGENVFVINLARRPEKLRRVLQQLSDHNLSATIVTAMDGDAIMYQDDLRALDVRVLAGYRGYSNHNMPFTTGEVGCFLSHYTIWHYMVERGIPSALILEDDFDLQDGFRENLGTCLREARGHNWNLLYLGRSPMENDVENVSEQLVVPGYTLWTVGYVLRLDAARLLLESNAHQHMVPLDDFFSVSMGCGTDGQFNERATEWLETIPVIFRALGTNPPLVMPYVGSLFLSDTAMLRPGTRFVEDLPITAPRAQKLAIEARTSVAKDEFLSRATDPTMPSAWHEALQAIEAFSAAAAAACNEHRRTSS